MTDIQFGTSGWRATIAEDFTFDNPPAELGGMPVVRLNRAEGLKLILEDRSWVLLRLSGIEPVARCYVEADSREESKRLTEVARQFFLST